MARKLEAFPDDVPGGGTRRYPWGEWTDGDVWEIRRGQDYDVESEHMRVNLHLKAEALSRKVRTKKFRDEDGERLVFQFLPSEERQAVAIALEGDPEGTRSALDQLYRDASEIYEQARREVRIEKADGTTQKYAAVRYKQQIDKAHAGGELVPAIARIVRRRTRGFGHLERARRPDLMLETLIVDTARPYHAFFSQPTVEGARRRLAEYAAGHGAIE